jgi:hypothetical protein
MDEKRGWLLPLWILAPLALFFAVLLASLALPETDCGENTTEGLDGTVVACLVLFSVAAAVAAGLYRLVTMSFRDQFASRDGWILLAGLVLLGLFAAGYTPAHSFGEGLAVGSLVLPGVALLALAAAAVSGRGVEEVGVLLPVYLFGAAYVYLVVGALGFLASSGIGC